MIKPEMTPVIIWGASGHASVIAEIFCLREKYEVVGFLDDVNKDRKGSPFCGAKVIGGKEELDSIQSNGIKHVFVAVGDCTARLNLARYVRDLGFSLPTITHPSAVVADTVTLGEGTVLVQSSSVNVNTKIGSCAIINTNSSVDHDCTIGNGVHISPGVAIGGRVSVGDGTWLGLGSSIIDGIHIGSNTIIGAGSVVVRDIPSNVVAYGVPARVIRKL